MAKKKERQFAIKKIVQEERIANQSELLARLEEDGYSTTQATLSRDLHEMGIVRIPTNDGYRYVISEQEGSHSLYKIVSMEILGIYNNENSLVVRTIYGRAKGVSIFIDQMKHQHILATVAGDNAVIVVPDSIQNLNSIREDLENIAVHKWS